MFIMKKHPVQGQYYLQIIFLLRSLLTALGIDAHCFHPLLTIKDLLQSYGSINKMKDVLWALTLLLKERRRKWKSFQPWEGGVYVLRVYPNLGKSVLFWYVQGTIGQSC